MEDAGPLAHPVQPQSYITIDNFYTATVYEKGAEVIGMLKTLVGDEGYRKATDLYFERHDGQAATVEDWVKCFEDACGRDLEPVPPLVSPGRHAGDRGATATMTREAQTYTLTLKQSLAPTPGQPDKKPMHIPVRLGLVGTSGGALPLTLEGENATGPDERVLELTRAEQRFVFVDVAEEPLLSLGRGFSAPAHLPGAAQTATTRAILMGTRQRRFQPLGSRPDRWPRRSCWKRLATRRHRRRRRSISTRIGEVLARAEDDPAFAAQMLMPPLESELALAMTPADPDAIHAARTALIRAIAAAHGARIGAALSSNARRRGRLQPGCEIGRAARLAQCLPALSHRRRRRSRGRAGRRALPHRHQHDRHDRGPGGADAHGNRRCATRPSPISMTASGRSAGARQMDEPAGGLAAARTPSTRVRALMKHPAFDIKNPNRVRALVGAFSGNHLRFHAARRRGLSRWWAK